MYVHKLVDDDDLPTELPPRLGAQWGERQIAAPTAGESPVRAAPRPRCLLPAGMACGQWQWSHYRSDEVGGRGGLCPALMGTLNVRL